MSGNRGSLGGERNERLQGRILRHVEDEPMEPWVVVGDVAKSEGVSEEEVHDALQDLTLEGELTPAAGGEIRIAEETE